MRVKKPSRSRKYVPQEIVNKPGKSQLLSPVFHLRQHASLLYAAERFNTCSMAEGAAVSLERYWKTKSKKVLQFQDITPLFLNEWERWMLRHGKRNKSDDGAGSPATLTTCRIYVERIKYVFNDVIRRDIIPASSYPFGKGKYISPQSSAGRDPRSKDDIRKIMEYAPVSEKESFFRDMWLFSYLSGGINTKDICLLKWDNYDKRQSRITFFRQKIKATTRTNMKPIVVQLSEAAVAIIDRWGIDEHHSFLFGVLSEDMSAYEAEIKKKYFIKQINDHMKYIAEKLGLKGDIRSYVARHSYANILLEQDVPLIFISQQFGHSKIATTQSYVARFNDAKAVDYNKLLI